MAEPNYTTEGPILYEFEGPSIPLPPGTKAAPRPPGRPREGEQAPLASDADVAFARELAERVWEYVRTQPPNMTAQQLTVLVWNYLTRRSARFEPTP